MRDLHDAFTSQGTPSIVGIQQELRETWNQLSLRAPRRNQPCLHLSFRLLASWIGRKYISITLSHLIYGNLSWQPQEPTQAHRSSLRKGGRGSQAGTFRESIGTSWGPGRRKWRQQVWMNISRILVLP